MKVVIKYNDGKSEEPENVKHIWANGAWLILTFEDSSTRWISVFEIVEAESPHESLTEW